VKAYFIELIAHEAWANRILLEALARESSVAERARVVFGHFCSAPDYWLKRVRGENFREHNWWPVFDVAELSARIDHSEQTWRDFLNRMPEPVELQTFETVNQRGDKITFRVVDILTQFHNHSSHHRGQIAVLFRAAGLEPIKTDFINWALERGR